MDATTTRPFVLSAESLEGNSVVNHAGEDLGTVTDFMIDLDSGRIAYAVLSFGGYFGLGDKLFAVPWGSLQADTVNERFVMNVDKETLEDAPGFDKNDWPDMASREWGTEIHSFYDVEPYWVGAA